MNLNNSRWLVALVVSILTVLAGTVTFAVTDSSEQSLTVYTAYSDNKTIYTSAAAAAAAEFAYRTSIPHPGGNSVCFGYRLFWYHNPPPSYYTAEWKDGVVIRGCSPVKFDVYNPLVVEHRCSGTNAGWRCPALLGPATEQNAGTTCVDTCGITNPGGEIKAEGTKSVGNPINVGTGNKYQVEVDFTTEGSPLLSFVRYYNSQHRIAPEVSLGKKWRHSFEYLLTKSPAGGFALHRPDGSITTYGRAGGDAKTSIGSVDFVTNTSSDVTGYVFDNLNGRRESYGLDGKINQISFLSGEFLNFSYDGNELLKSVTDQFSRKIDFAYNSSNLLTTVTAPDGRQYGYSYNVLNGDKYPLLEKRIAPGSMTKTYVYDGEASASASSGQMGLLTETHDERGVKTGQYWYNPRGQAATTAGASVDSQDTNKYVVSYGATSTIITHPMGAKEEFIFEVVDGTPRIASSKISKSGMPIQTAKNTYDSRGNITSTLNYDGALKCMKYDSSGRGLLVRTVEGLAPEALCENALSDQGLPAPAKVTTLEWHGSYRIPVRVFSPGVVEIFSYDVKGRLISRTINATSDKTGVQGLNATLVGPSKTTSYSYNDFGQITSVTLPGNRVSGYAYDIAGNLVSMTNSLGQVTTYSGYDAAGRVGQIVAPSGLRVNLTYDASGRLSTLNKGGLITTYSYTPNGKVFTVSSPDGEVLTYGYDNAARLVSITDQRGNKKELGLDLAGNELKRRNATLQGVVTLETIRSFDAYNRLSSISGAHFFEVQPAGYVPAAAGMNLISVF